VKTFLEISAINESKAGSEVMKNLTTVHKLELEIQDIQRNVVELYDKAGKYKFDSKERNKIEEKIKKFLEEKQEIEKEMEYERRILIKSLSYIDGDGELNKFFE
jgi:hypothetical protein